MSRALLRELTWIENVTTDVRTKRSQFFGPILRMLAERPCGMMVAVDERYLDVQEYRAAREGILPTEVTIPRIGDSRVFVFSWNTASGRFSTLP